MLKINAPKAFGAKLTSSKGLLDPPSGSVPIDDPRPLFGCSAETGGHRVLSNVIHFDRQLFATLIIAQSMIEETFLPSDSVFARVEMFPIPDDANHRFFGRERQEC